MKNCSTVWVVTSIVIRSRHGVVFRHSLMFLLKPLQKQGKCHAFYNWRLFTVTKCSTHNENCLRHCWETVMGHHVHRWHTTGLIHSFIHSFSSFFIHLDSKFFCSATTIAWRPLLRARNRPWSFFRLGFEATSTRWATRRSPNWANRAAALNALVSADSHVYAENLTYTYNSWPRYWASRICMNITDYFSPTICINLNLRPRSTDKSKTHFEFLSVFAFLRLILNSNRARQIAEKQSTRKINYH